MDLENYKKLIDENLEIKNTKNKLNYINKEILNNENNIKFQYKI